MLPLFSELGRGTLAELQVLSVGRSLATRLASGIRIKRRDLNQTLSDHFGGSDADGAWSIEDANAALEITQVLFLAHCSELCITSNSGMARALTAKLTALIPTQSVRSDTQIVLQQFSTPPELAWIAARAAAIRTTDIVLEPSAGLGMLALWADKAGARLVLNEISAPRRACLSALFPRATISGHDAELVHELLHPTIALDVVMMNPPFSHGVERGHDGKTGARHVRAAWTRLRPGGRLVAILPDWFDVGRFLAHDTGPATLRLKEQAARELGDMLVETGAETLDPAKLRQLLRGAIALGLDAAIARLAASN